jgi:signal peptidase I
MFGKKQRPVSSTGVRDSPVESEESEDAETSEAKTAENTPSDDLKKQQKRTILRFFIKLGSLCLILWVIFTYIFGLMQQYGENMYARIRDGDLVLYYRLQGDYAIDDVAVFDVNGTKCIARVVAAGGDVVEVSEDGELIVNGNTRFNETSYPIVENPDGISYPYTVEEGSYFLLYDYYCAVGDSRTQGAVAQKDLYGKVITILRRRGI